MMKNPCQQHERDGLAFDWMSSLLLIIFLNMYKAIYTCGLAGHNSGDTGTL